MSLVKMEELEAMDQILATPFFLGIRVISSFTRGDLSSHARNKRRWV